MKIKIASILTAVTCISILGSMCASAAWEVVENDSPALSIITEQGRFNGILVETNGTTLTEDMVNTLDGYAGLETWEEYVSVYWNGKIETSVNPGDNGYMISLEEMDDETLHAIGRQLMLNQECIENVYLVDYAEYHVGYFLNLLAIVPFSADYELDETLIPELEGFQITDARSYSGAYRCYLEDPVSCGFYDGINLETATAYALYKCWADYADMIMNKYSDAIDSVEVELAVEANSTAIPECTSTSIWQTAGDPNADGAVDAKDAASILQTAAENGTGAGIAATSATDVNADGEVNAKDAAAVLVYAAEEGAGKTPDWVEILRR